MMIPEYQIVIPARMASSRLPGKPLLDVAGRPLIEHAYRAAARSSALKVVIATEDEDIGKWAASIGADSVMTSSRHRSGSDRIAECADLLGWEDETVIVNLQADEPLMPPGCLDQVAALLAGDPAADAASLYWPIDSPAEADDPDTVKVVVDQHGAALYFSRAKVPFIREPASARGARPVPPAWKRHIGLYAYRVRALRVFTATVPTPLETAERLEQLRFLESGRKILMARAREAIPPGVDTPGDLQRLRDDLPDLS